MGLDILVTEIVPGSTPPAMLDRIIMGLQYGVSIPGPSAAPVTGAFLQDTGAGYTSTPTAAAPSTGSRSGATFTVKMALAALAINAIGATYAPGDTITLSGGTSTTAAIVTVATTALVAAPSVVAAGNGYNVGDQITLQGGAIVTVATLTGGAGTGVATITLTNKGAFFANITSAGGLTQQSTTGGGAGATFTSAAANYGVGTFAITNAGVYSVCATTFTQSATSGSGLGATFQTGSFQVGSLASNAAGVGYSNGDAVTFTGGSPTRTASGVLTTNPINAPITVLVQSFQGLPSNYLVDLDTDGPAIVNVHSKTNAGFSVTLTPVTSTGPLLATKLNFALMG